jgi:hypothetical protein
MTVAIRLILLLLLLAILPTSPARAAGFGPPIRVTPDGCSVARFLTDSRGVVRGAATCSDGRVSVLTRGGASWQRAVTTWRGTVLAVADDGSALFVLSAKDGTLFVARRTHGDKTYPQRVLGQHNAVQAVMVARNGHWHAVWRTYVPPGDVPDHLWQGGTLFPGGATQITFDAHTDVAPQLAFGPAGQLVLAWERFTSPSSVRFATATEGTWRSRQLSPRGVAATGAALVAGRDGSAVAWIEGPHRQLRLTRLPSGGGTTTALWSRGDVSEIAMSGPATAPLLFLRAGAGAATRHLYVRRLANGFGSEDVTVPADEYAEDINALAVGGSAQHPVLLYMDQRQSGPDPQYAQDASAVLSRTR